MTKLEPAEDLARQFRRCASAYVEDEEPVIVWDVARQVTLIESDRAAAVGEAMGELRAAVEAHRDKAQRLYNDTEDPSLEQYYGGCNDGFAYVLAKLDALAKGGK